MRSFEVQKNSTWTKSRVPLAVCVVRHPTAVISLYAQLHTCHVVLCKAFDDLQRLIIAHIYIFFGIPSFFEHCTVTQIVLDPTLVLCVVIIMKL